MITLVIIKKHRVLFLLDSYFCNSYQTHVLTAGKYRAELKFLNCSVLAWEIMFITALCRNNFITRCKRSGFSGGSKLSPGKGHTGRLETQQAVKSKPFASELSFVQYELSLISPCALEEYFHP